VSRDDLKTTSPFFNHLLFLVLHIFEFKRINMAVNCDRQMNLYKVAVNSPSTPFLRTFSQRSQAGRKGRCAIATCNKTQLSIDTVVLLVVANACGGTRQFVARPPLVMHRLRVL